MRLRLGRERVTMGEIFIIHAADARSFACRAAAQLAAEGYSVLRRDAAEAADDIADTGPVIAVWSPGLSGLGHSIEALRRALAQRILVPIAIAGAEPPSAFAGLWPIDLDGWDGDGDDPRWQFVRDEIKLAQLRAETEGAERRKPQAAPRPRRVVEPSSTLLVRMIPPAAAGLAVLSATAVLMATPGNDAPSVGDESAVSSELLQPAAPTQTAAGSAAATAPGRDGALRTAGPTLASVMSPPKQAESDQAPPEPVDLVARLLEADRSAASKIDFAEDAVAPPPAKETTIAETESTPNAAKPPDAEPAAAPASASPSVGPAAPKPAAAFESLPLPAPAPDDFAGVVFRDCVDCPDMAEIPAGVFEMGAAPGDADATASESPVRRVAIATAFALSRREITFKQWQACVADGGCRGYAPADAGWGRGDRPVINVSWDDAEAYAAWLSEKTGHVYRLPSEAEWEYAARAGGSTRIANAGVVSPMLANFEDGGRGRTAPTGSFKPSAFGLYDMLGNVWEWVADCWRDSHLGAPGDGSAVTGDCKQRTLKGGAYNSSAWRLRPAHRIAKQQSAREADNGFRVARDLP